MKMKNKCEVYWTATAQSDLVDIIKYITDDNGRQIAETIYLRIKEKSFKLENNPMLGRVVPEFKMLNIENYRELIENRWRIIYKTDGSKLFIVSVIDSRRNVEDILLDRFMQKE